MKCLFAYNPISGKGKIKKNLDYIVERLSEKYDEVTVYETKKAGDMSLIGAEEADKYDAFVFAGGDGTFNEVINGFAPLGKKPTLAYIPTGTVNDIARSMGIKRNIKKALDVVINGTPTDFDIVKVNDRYCDYTVCYGGMTTCSYSAKQSAKKKFGKLAYANYILKYDTKFDMFHTSYTVDGKQCETDAVMIMVINSRSVSSFRLNKKADLHDGMVDVVIVKERKKKGELNFFRRLRNFFKAISLFLFGVSFAKRSKSMIYYKCSQTEFTVSDKKTWNFDGEKGDEGDITLSVVKDGLRLIVPKGKKL